MSIKSTKILWGRSAGRCAMADCRIQLVMDVSETDDPTLIGEECHIVARSAEGPRGQNDLPDYRRDLYGNLILLCRNHHKIIDDHPNTYTIEVLKRIKHDHEAWVRQNVEIYDEAKQRDEEYYVGIIEKWEHDCEVNNLEAWASWMFGSGRPEMRADLDDALFEFRWWLFLRIWPGRYP